ncbi:hypothetical protein Tco_0833750 [Tanacetum coccineum]
MQMEPYESFPCRCERGDVVLRKSHKPHIFGRLYYACPRSKPSQQDHGCGYFKWKDETTFGNASSFSRPSTPSISSVRASSSSGPSRAALNFGRMLKLRASQEGLAERMTDDGIMDKVLGSSRAFKPGRGRKLPNSASSSSICSCPAPPQSTSQAALRKLVETHNEQMKYMHSQLADKNIELQLPVPLDPNDFMDDVSDESDKGNATEDAADPEDE